MNSFTEQGTVEKVVGERIFVRVERTSSCAGCNSCGFCQVLSEREMLVQAVNRFPVRKGAQVELSIPSRSLLKISLLVYLLPVTGLVAGAVLGTRLALSLKIHETMGTLFGGVLLFVLILCILVRYERSWSHKSAYLPQISRVLSTKSSSGQLGLKTD